MATAAHDPNAKLPFCNASHTGAYPKHIDRCLVRISPQICPPLLSVNNRGVSRQAFSQTAPSLLAPCHSSHTDVSYYTAFTESTICSSNLSQYIKERLKVEKCWRWGWVPMPAEQLSLVPHGCIMAHTVQQRVLHDTKSITATGRGNTARQGGKCSAQQRSHRSV